MGGDGNRLHPAGYDRFASILHPDDGHDLARLRSRHNRQVAIRICTSVVMGLFALGPFLFRLIGPRNMIGVAAAIAFIAAFAIVSVAALRSVKNFVVFVVFSILDNCSAIVGYTGIMCALGGHEALYLTPIYTIYIFYVGTNGTVQAPYILASFSAIAIAFLFELAHLGIVPQLSFAPWNLPWGNEVTILFAVIGLLYVAAFLAQIARRQARAQRESLRNRNVALEQANQESRWLAREADTANRAKSEFLANMSHELRTPLNHVIGFTDLVLEESVGALNDSQKEYLQDVAFSSRHLLSLIDDILDLSKVEAGKLELHLAEVPLVSVLEHCIVMIKERAIKHGIEVSVDVSKAPVRIRADELRLRQVVYNLLSNAVKFTLDGGRVSLQAWARDHTDSGALLEISVSDNGIGIEEGNLERIFLPFEQVEGTGGKQLGGTGLGLSLSRQLVELHGGRIWAESEGLGKGSTFHVSLPFS